MLVTAHRRENWPYLANICEALLALCRHYPMLEAVFPLHPNPLVRQIVHPLLDHEPRISLTAPLDYIALQQELAQATLVLTDSGGIQEEAAGFRVPCLVLRDTTERPEAIEAGMADLVGVDPARILAAARAWIEGERRIDPARPIRLAMAGPPAASVRTWPTSGPAGQGPVMLRLMLLAGLGAAVTAQAAQPAPATSDFCRRILG